MNWQDTINNPLGIYQDAGPVVIGANTDDGGGEALQVVGPTALDSQAIVTDGSGLITINDPGQIQLANAAQDALVTLQSGFGGPTFTMQGQVSTGGVAATISLTNHRDLHIIPGIDDASVKGYLGLAPAAGYKVLIGTNTTGGSVLRVVGLPTGNGTPPGGLSAGDLWVDTALGAHQGVLKVY